MTTNKDKSAEIARLKSRLAVTERKLSKAMGEARKWQRIAKRHGPRPSRAEEAEAQASLNASLAKMKGLFAGQAKLKKVTALADDERGNENERVVATAMAAKLRAKRGR